MVYDILQWLYEARGQIVISAGPCMITTHVHHVYIVQGLDYLGF